jgi:septal ring factor EnvC (AmiA/AmiB activator)
MATSANLHATPLPSYAPSSCPRCHTPLPNSITPEEAQKRIQDLEAQVKLLNSKAAAAVDKLADYEDEVRFLRAVHARSQQDGNNGRAASPPPDSTSEVLRPQPQSRLSSLSAFLPGRRNSPQTPNTATFPPIPPVPPIPQQQFSSASTSTPNLLNGAHDPQPQNDLTTLLQNERAARQSAEQSLNRAHSELEELTAQLFGQANEMVATERRARAKLEERVQILEKRDSEKRRRLERLEKAIERIERVRTMVRS